MTTESTNRYDMLGPPCEKALPIWKRLVIEKLNSLDIEVDIDNIPYDEEDGFHGRMCRPCTSTLERYEKLRLSTLKNIDDAIDVLINGDHWQNIQSMKRARDEDETDAEVRISRSHAIPTPTLPNTNNEEDVAVGYNILCNFY